MAPSPWAEFREGTNPYRRTAFQVLGIGACVKSRGEVKAAIRQRRRRVAATPERFPLFGDVLSVAQVNEAEQRLDDPEGWVFAELCMHRPRAMAVDVSGAAERLAGLVPTIPRTAPKVDAVRLARLIPALERRTFAPLIDC